MSSTSTSKISTFSLPDLVEIQRASFCWFLEEGLAEEIKNFSPITDYTDNLELHLLGDEYKLKYPKYSINECKRRDATYSVQVYVPARLINKENGAVLAKDDKGEHHIVTKYDVIQSLAQ